MPNNDTTEVDKKNEREIEEIIKGQKRSRRIKRDPTKVIGEEGALERDGLYTEILESFSKNYNNTKKQTRKQKTVFFTVILISLVLLLISGIGILYLSMFVCNTCNIAVVIGASVDILGTFIAIPTIIAKHLFPEKLDNDVIKVVQLLVENDKNVRETKEKHNNKG